MSSGAASRTRLALVLLALAALALVTYGRVLGFELMGHDTYPVILTSRVTSPGDLLRLFGQPLLAGDFGIAYYRPLPGLTFALDHALWGTAPRGYQATDLALLLAAGGALFALARRLTGGLAGPALTALVYLLFHAQFEVLPVPSRRNHTLVVLFLALTLREVLGPRVRAGVRSAAAAGLFALCAMLSNEIALVAFPLAVVAAALAGPEAGAAPAGRLAFGLRRALPVGVATLLAVALRAVVLGGLGGPETARLPTLAAWGRLARHVFVPYPELAGASVALATLAALGVGLMGLCFVKRDETRRITRPALAGVGVGLAWMLATALPIVASGKLRHWYAVHGGAGLALAAGALFAGLLTMRRSGGAVHRASAVGLIGIAALTVLSIAASPLVQPYEQWTRGGAAQRAFLDDLRPRIAAAPAGSTLRIRGLPVRATRATQPVRRDARVYSPALLGLGSLRAWAALEFPGRAVLVQAADRPVAQPAPGELLLLVTPAAEGSGLR